MENLNLVEILKDCPIGTKLYSPIVGEVELETVSTDASDTYPIVTHYKDCNSSYQVISFTRDGRYFRKALSGECILFPSKDQRDWSKFGISEIPEINPKIFKPYDKVLVRDDNEEPWKCSFFSNLGDNDSYPYRAMDNVYAQCIPYNEETEYLLGTTEEPPAHYKSLCKTIE